MNGLQVFVGLYVKTVTIWLGVMAVFFLVGLAACARQRSPLEEMFTANARGEVACVRDGVLRHGRENCK